MVQGFYLRGAEDMVRQAALRPDGQRSADVVQVVTPREFGLAAANEFLHCPIKPNATRTNKAGDLIAVCRGLVVDDALRRVCVVVIRPL